MPFGWLGGWGEPDPTPPQPKVGRPNRGGRAKVKAGRKAAKRR